MSLDTLGETKVPSVFAKLLAKGLCDSLKILRADEGEDEAGNNTDTRNPAEVDDEDLIVPCIVESTTQSIKSEFSNQWVSVHGYKVTMPTNQNGALIDLRADDRLQVLARGNQPERIYQIISIGNVMGVLSEVFCRLEN